MLRLGAVLASSLKCCVLLLERLLLGLDALTLLHGSAKLLLVRGEVRIGGSFGLGGGLASARSPPQQLRSPSNAASCAGELLSVRLRVTRRVGISCRVALRLLKLGR